MLDYELFHGDCLEKMSLIQSNSVDFVFTDLPYGTTKNAEDKRIPFSSLWEQFNRIIKEDGCIALFAQGAFYIDLVNSNRKMFRYDLIWDKVLVTGFLNANVMPLRQHEQIAIFYKKTPTYNPQFTQGKPQHSKGIGYKSKIVTNQNYENYRISNDYRKGSTDKYPTSILKFAKPHPSVALHRTSKPLSICTYLIKTYSNIGDTILDCCMGSGVIGEAALLTNRKYKGIEKNETIFSLASIRLEEVMNEIERRTV